MDESRFTERIPCEFLGGEAYLAHDTALGRDVELRVAHGSNGSSDAAFLHEARVTGLLEHPGVAGVLELGALDDGRAWYTLRLARGKPLSALLASTTRMADRLALLPHFCDGARIVAYAHGRGVVHGDLSPDSIVVGEFGEVSVAGWSRARALHHPEWRPHPRAETSEDDRQHVPAFAAPEAERGAPDIRSDVYSLGAILREILSPPSPTPAPQSLLQVVEGATAYDVARRYESVSEFVEAVERESPRPGHGAGRSRATFRFPRVQSRVFRLVSGAVAMTLVAGVVLWGVLAPRTGDGNETERLAAPDTSVADDEFGTNEDLYNLLRPMSERELVAHDRYLARILEADRAIKHRAYDRARAALDDTPLELRNWEWDHLNRLASQESETIAVGGGPVITVRTRPQREQWVTASNDGFIRFWDGVTHQLEEEIHADMRAVRTFSFSEDGMGLATLAENGELLLWNLSENAPPREVTGRAANHHNALVYSIDHERLVWSSGRRTLQVQNPVTQDDLGRLRGHRANVMSTALTPDGRYLLSGDASGLVLVWDGKTLDREFDITFPDGWISSIAVAPDNSRAAIGTLEGPVHLFDLAEFRSLGVLEGHEAIVWGLAFSADGTMLASGAADRTARLWDVANVSQLARFEGHNGEVNSVTFSSNGEELVTVSDDGYAKVWEIADWIRADDGAPTTLAQGRMVLPIDASPVTDALFDGTGRYVLTVSRGDTAEFWDTRAGERISVLEESSRTPISAIALAPDRSLAAVGRYDGALTLWRPATGEVVHEIHAQDGPVYAIAFDGGTNYVATGGANGAANVRDVESGEVVSHLRGHRDDVTSVDFTAFGPRVATGSRDGTIRIWEIVRGTTILILKHEYWPQRIYWGNRGRFLFSLNVGQNAFLWNLREELAPYRVFEGHWANVNGLASSTDRAFTVSHDRTLKVWDVRTAKELLSLPSGDESLLRVAYDTESGDVRALARNGAIYTWRARPDRALPSTPDEDAAADDGGEEQDGE